MQVVIMKESVFNRRRAKVWLNHLVKKNSVFYFRSIIEKVLNGKEKSGCDHLLI